jgi:hypothetical protein
MDRRHPANHARFLTVADQRGLKSRLRAGASGSAPALWEKSLPREIVVVERLWRNSGVEMASCLALEEVRNMEMQVDSKRIRSERENRAWSEEPLN